MEICKSMSAKYPTVQYGSVDLFTSVKLSDVDLATLLADPRYADCVNAPLETKHKILDDFATYLLQKGFVESLNTLQANTQVVDSLYTKLEIKKRT